MVQVTFFPSGGGGAAAQDRFAPKYLVGNTANGDTASGAGLAAGFQYFPDPGDGTGIAAALAAALAVPGDVWIRPGTYDLQTGAVVTPMVIPPGCTVRGSGTGSTRIIGRSTGDQGVFVVTTDIVTPPGGRFAGLSDLSIQSPAAADGTGTSTAVIRSIDLTTIERVVVAFAPNATGVLREAFRYETMIGFGAANLNEALIFALGDGSASSTGIVLASGQAGGPTVVAHAIQVVGATGFLNIGIDVAAGNFIGSAIAVLQFTEAAVRFTGASFTGSIRINEGTFNTGSGNAATIGASLTGSGHVLRSVQIQSSIGDIGIRLITPGFIPPLPDPPVIGVTRDVTIDDCAISGFDNGIVGGSLLDLAAISSTTVTNCIIGASGRGIALFDASSCHLLDNDVQVSQFSSAAPQSAIEIRENAQGVGSVANFIKGNSASMTCTVQDHAAHTIYIESQLSVVEGNNAVCTNGGYAIELGSGSERVTVTGNVTQSAGNPNLPADPLGCIHIATGTPNIRSTVTGNSCTLNLAADNAATGAIVHDGVSCTISNNSIFLGTPNPGITPGILLSATSTTTVVLGNVVDGSGGTAVSDLGTFNEVAHNIGA